MTRTSLLLAAVLAPAIAVGPAIAKQPPRCPDATYVITSGSVLAGAGGGIIDTITLAGRTVALGSECALRKGKVTARGARVRWGRCAVLRKVVLKARLDDTCALMTGTVKARGIAKQAFEAGALPATTTSTTPLSETTTTTLMFPPCDDHAPAVGDKVVTNCADDAQLSSQLAGGGAVTFDCGTATIDLGDVKTISTDTTIDGRCTITLSGQDMHRLFLVDSGAALTLRNIVLTNGFSGGNGGAIFNGDAASSAHGSVTIENSTIRDSRSGQSGGAIVSTGPLTIRSSLLEGNQALNGGALYVRYAAANTQLFDSVLRNNQATDPTNGWGGAMLIWEGAPVSVRSSDIDGNSARTGGGIYNFPGASLSLSQGTVLRNNTASVDGGGLANFASAYLSDVSVGGNAAGAEGYGGGVYTKSAASGVSIRSATLSHNTAYLGAGLANLQGFSNFEDVTIRDNSAGISGGGVYNVGSALSLNRSTVSNNSGSVGAGVYNHSPATVTNVTFSGNSASFTGGAFINFSPTTLTNVTFSGNSGPSGGAINHRGLTPADTLILKNTIVADSPAGGNCFKQTTSMTPIGSAGYNISSDNTCALSGAGDANLVDPQLGPLADHGGPTRVHLPGLGSPAIDGVIGNDAPLEDQRDVTRPQGGGYDIGAVERQASDVDAAAAGAAGR